MCGRSAACLQIRPKANAINVDGCWNSNIPRGLGKSPYEAVDTRLEPQAQGWKEGWLGARWWVFSAPVGDLAWIS